MVSLLSILTCTDTFLFITPHTHVHIYTCMPTSVKFGHALALCMLMHYQFSTLATIV